MPHKVYFISSRADSRERNVKKYRRMLRELDFGRIITSGDLVAIKTSFGEQGNLTYLRPQYARLVVDEVKRLGGKPFLTDSNTLYAGGRQNSRDHIVTAVENGFTYSVTGAPVVIADGLKGRDFRTVPIEGRHFSEAKIAALALDSNAIISLAHFKGHMVCGFGGAIKNLGMGFGARSGKQMMHSDVLPVVKPDECTACAQCIKWCPEDAIALVPHERADGKGVKVALIDPEACIGCGECVATCFEGAIDINWKSDPAIVQEKMAEYATAALTETRTKFAAINHVMDVTPDCDCLGWSDNPIVPNIGIVASFDPVAADAAALDLVNQAAGISDSALPREGSGEDKFGSIHKGIDSTAQLRHAESLGLGSASYELVPLDRAETEED
ncbi:MAG: DUF362 domain-containing protein [Gaiellales bacterium]|nr:MAG: DUF362 domain-containing protein [Gaiellales bacterium]